MTPRVDHAGGFKTWVLVISAETSQGAIEANFLSAARSPAAAKVVGNFNMRALLEGIASIPKDIRDN